jgi:hypothetical protein
MPKWAVSKYKVTEFHWRYSHELQPVSKVVFFQGDSIRVGIVDLHNNPILSPPYPLRIEVFVSQHSTGCDSIKDVGGARKPRLSLYLSTFTDRYGSYLYIFSRVWGNHGPRAVSCWCSCPPVCISPPTHMAVRRIVRARTKSANDSKEHKFWIRSTFRVATKMVIIQFCFVDYAMTEIWSWMRLG